MTRRDFHRLADEASLQGRKVPVTAGTPGDRNDAIAIAKTRPWWPQVVHPERAVMRGGKWWFSLRPEIEGET